QIPIGRRRYSLLETAKHPSSGDPARCWDWHPQIAEGARAPSGIAGAQLESQHIGPELWRSTDRAAPRFPAPSPLPSTSFAPNTVAQGPGERRPGWEPSARQPGIVLRPGDIVSPACILHPELNGRLRRMETSALTPARRFAPRRYRPGRGSVSQGFAKRAANPVSGAAPLAVRCWLARGFRFASMLNPNSSGLAPNQPHLSRFSANRLRHPAPYFAPSAAVHDLSARTHLWALV